ncbi:hypothetical protein L596_009735 [Steinernema carpocapsae]|uniref:Nucleotide-diphospho-sugar transferase domain-containing protein n=1 Tax=Steinernema carpocapsae TaxID=34508 RepID=A0A4U5PH16_STECR|nr:hypothetical protein L596_009735 [Steinernema carpocapsae]
MLEVKLDPMVKMYNLDRYERFPVYLAWNDLPRKVTFRRQKQALDVGILIIIDEKTDLKEYLFALESVSCYAKMHNYPLELIRDTLKWRHLCPQSNLMFRRHCMVAHFLSNHTWTLFLDADTGVVNPNKLIEEWIDPKVDLILYDRFYNREVAAGSYLAKNSDTAKAFLHAFANYEYRIPANFHGWDNGALHALLLEWNFPSQISKIQVCLDAWTQSTGWDDLFTFEACFRAFVGQSMTFKDMKILPKATGWMRDGWITSGKWSPETDFMIHGWKMETLVPPRLAMIMDKLDLDQMRLIRFAGWVPPFAKLFDQKMCKNGDPIWHFNGDLVVSGNEIRRRLAELKETVDEKYKISLSRLDALLDRKTFQISRII